MKSRRTTQIHLMVLAVYLLLAGFPVQAEGSPKQPNVLLLIIDDLRVDLDRFYAGGAHMPSLDRLADQSIQFDQAYTNVPVCGASRASFLTGVRPSRERFLDYHTRAQEDASGVVSMPEAFRRKGYVTHSIGKVFHHLDDFSDSWTVPAWNPSIEGDSQSWRDYQTEERLAWERQENPSAWEAADVPDNAYFDGRQADRAIEFLEKHSDESQPFFLALGFVKPHLPYNAPQKYWDLFDPQKIMLSDVDPARNAPEAAWHNIGEIRAYREIPEEPKAINAETSRSLIHGYLASVAYADAQAGRVMDALQRLDLDDNTIVVFMSDHGYALGEHELWVKHSTFKVALQVPLMFRVPGQSGGEIRDNLAEYVDVFPTLAELAGLEVPDGQLDGLSLAAQIKDSSVPGKKAVYPRWKNAESIRTGTYLYTEWLDEQGVVYARMLYDHSSDPDERINIAEQAGMADVVKALSGDLARLRSQL